MRPRILLTRVAHHSVSGELQVAATMPAESKAGYLGFFA